MLKKSKKKSVKTLRNKADRLLQELGRKVYKKCIVCGKPMDCMHHFITRGRSSYLRYYWDNCVPICTPCHVAIELRKCHEITAKIVFVKGAEWVEKLEKLKSRYVKTDKAYYEKIINELNKGL